MRINKGKISAFFPGVSINAASPQVISALGWWRDGETEQWANKRGEDGGERDTDRRRGEDTLRNSLP